jgi:uncharacterized membrane protein
MALSNLQRFETVVTLLAIDCFVFLLALKLDHLVGLKSAAYSMWPDACEKNS